MEDAKGWMESNFTATEVVIRHLSLVIYAERGHFQNQQAIAG